MLWGVYSRYATENINYNNYNKNEILGILNTKQFGRLPACSPNPGEPDRQNDYIQYTQYLNFKLAKDRGLNIEKYEKKQQLLKEEEKQIPTNLRKQSCQSLSKYHDTSYFQHVRGNSWHVDSQGAFMLNFVGGCHPIHFGFLCLILLISLYCLLYRNRHNKIHWLQQNGLLIIGLIAGTLILITWRHFLFGFQKHSCSSR